MATGNNDPSACRIAEATVAFGSILVTYITLIDLGSIFERTHMIIENTLDNDVTLNFVGNAQNNEITVVAGSDYTFDQFKHFGLVQIKYTSAASTSGNIIVKSWN